MIHFLSVIASTPIPVTTEIPVPVKTVNPVMVSYPIVVWVAWLTSLAMGLGAIGVIFAFVKRASKLVYEVVEYRSVLVHIGRHFKEDSTSSLPAKIDNIEKFVLKNDTRLGAIETALSNKERLKFLESAVLKTEGFHKHVDE